MALTHCLQCGKKLGPRKKKFCRNKCKDRWHNINNPRGYYAHLNPDDPDFDENDLLDVDEGPEGWDGHKMSNWM